MSKDVEWRVEDYINRLLPKKHGLSNEFQKKTQQYISDEDVTDAMIEDCYIIMAHIVKKNGIQYLPIFERLHAEQEIRQKQKDMLSKALEISDTHPLKH